MEQYIILFNKVIWSTYTIFKSKKNIFEINSTMEAIEAIDFYLLNELNN